MPLTSTLFKGDPKLEACAERDSAHIMLGARGPHVKKIQTALVSLDSSRIDAAELNAMYYGSSTANAVLLYKKKRDIINRAYQWTADNIVGRWTIASLDRGMAGGNSSIDPDMRLVNEADMRRLNALQKAEALLVELRSRFAPGVPDPNHAVVRAMQRQLFVVLDSNFWSVVDQLIGLIQSNRLTRSHFIVNKSFPEFAHVDPSLEPGKGVTACASFFAPATNDNCRHEVICHEFFHFSVGAQHFYSATSTAEAMRCPHHLARVVFDIALGQQLAPCFGGDHVCR